MTGALAGVPIILTSVVVTISIIVVAPLATMSGFDVVVESFVGVGGSGSGYYSRNLVLLGEQQSCGNRGESESRVALSLFARLNSDGRNH